MHKQDRYLQSICRASPGLNITSVQFGRGQNSDVLIINGELVLRFPKYPHVLERLRVETSILAGIQTYVSMAVPKPIFVYLEGQAVGEAFMGYRLIPGEPLWRETFRAIGDEKIVQALASQLGAFLRALHGVPYWEAIDRELPRQDTYEESADIYRRVRQALFPHMRPDARRWAGNHFETFLRDTDNFAYRPVLTHSDFGPSNILFDPQVRRVRGIIDFGSSGLGDPAYDFAGLLSGYGEIFVRRCIRTYPELELFLDRVRFYQGTFALLEALFGVENDDPQAFRRGMERYV